SNAHGHDYGKVVDAWALVRIAGRLENRGIELTTDAYRQVLAVDGRCSVQEIPRVEANGDFGAFVVDADFIEAFTAFRALAFEAQLARRKRELDASRSVAGCQRDGPERIADECARSSHHSRAGLGNDLLVRRKLRLDEFHTEAEPGRLEESIRVRLDQSQRGARIGGQGFVAQAPELLHTLERDQHAERGLG